MMWGLDFLGVARYADLAAAEMPDGWALGAFSNTFGDALPAVRRIAQSGRVPRIRLHLAWKDDHRFGDLEFVQVGREALRVAPLVEAFPRIDWRISFACEHMLKRNEIARWVAMVRRAIPTAKVVNAPWVQGGGQIVPGMINEVHGTKAQAPRGQFDFSYDGQNCVDSDHATMLRRMQRADTFYLWASQCNGRMTTQDKTPRPERRAWPTSRYIDSWIALSRPRGGAVSLPHGWIYKSHADQHVVPPEPRAGKPVWIYPGNFRQIEMRTDNGQVVNVARYFGPFSGGGSRAYCGEWGYLIAEKARRIQGHPICSVFADGKLVGRINPAFRAGTFR